MDPDRHEWVSELFLGARALEGAARRAFLEEACGEDGELLAEVESLLSASEQSVIVDRTLQSDVLAELAVDAEGKTRPERIGEYEILDVLGEGGMGTVYRARQSNPHREVALKVVRAGFADGDTQKRFEVEAHLLGRLRHPGIAWIHEAGVAHSALGRQPFLVMELVEGQRIDEYAEGRGLSEKVELIARVADAVQHAHEKGVLHRDLKPSNVLVEEGGQPKVLDFGVARAIDDSPVDTMLTQPGQIVGTLATMAPEQITGEVGVRSDVYALGVLAYRLLAGRNPIDIQGLSVPDAAARIVGAVPRRLGAWDRQLRGDLETIVEKALSKEPERRYASAAAYADDLRRHLRHEPVLARPPSSVYQLGRLARRHRAVFAGASLALISLIVGLFGALLYASRSVLAREESDEVVAFLSEVLQTAHPDSLGHQALVVDALDQAAERLAGRSLGRRPGLEARLQETLAGAYYSLGLLDRARTHAELAGGLRPREELPLDLMRLRARLHIEFGEYAEGLALARELEAQARRRVGPQDDLVIEAMGIGVRGLTSLVRYEEAERQVLEAIEMVEATDRTGEGFYFDLLESHSEVLRQMGRLEESLAPLERLSILVAEKNGPTHSTTLAFHTFHAVRLFELGNHQEAEERLVALRELAETHLGPDSTTTINILEHLAMLYRTVGRLDEAIELIRTVAEQRLELFGPRHTPVVLAQIELAKNLLARGRSSEAQEIAADAHLVSLDLEGPSSMVTVSAASVVANCSYRLQNYEESAEICREAIEAAVDMPASSPMLLQIRSLLAAALQQQGELHEAHGILTETIPLAEECFGAEHPQVYIFHLILGDVHAGRGDHELARASYRTAADGLDATMGPTSVQGKQARQKLQRLESSVREAAAPKQ